MILKQFPEKTEFNKMAQTCNVIPLCTQILADTQTLCRFLKGFTKITNLFFF